MKENKSKEQQLREEREDLFFKMMFAAFEQTDAPKYEALNEQLKNNPENQESEEETQAMLDFIDREIRKRDNELKKQEKHGRHVISTLSRALLVAILIMLLGGTAYAAIPSFRAMTQNLLLEVSKVATRMALTDSSTRQDRDEIADGTEIVLLGYRFPGVPGGFMLEDEWHGENRAWIQYANKVGKSLKYQVCCSVERDMAIDTEGATAEDIEIHGCEGVLSIEGNDVIISWYDKNTRTMILIETEGLHESFAFNIANDVDLER